MCACECARKGMIAEFARIVVRLTCVKLYLRVCVCVCVRLCGCAIVVFVCVCDCMKDSSGDSFVCGFNPTPVLQFALER